MPNWCENYLEITAPSNDKADVTKTSPSLTFLMDGVSSCGKNPEDLVEQNDEHFEISCKMETLCD